MGCYLNTCRVGHIYIYIYIYICISHGICTVLLAGESPNIRSYTVYIYGSGQPSSMSFLMRVFPSYSGFPWSFAFDTNCLRYQFSLLMATPPLIMVIHTHTHRHTRTHTQPYTTAHTYTQTQTQTAHKHTHTLTQIQTQTNGATSTDAAADAETEAAVDAAAAALKKDPKPMCLIPGWLAEVPQDLSSDSWAYRCIRRWGLLPPFHWCVFECMSVCILARLCVCVCVCVCVYVCVLAHVCVCECVCVVTNGLCFVGVWWLKTKVMADCTYSPERQWQAHHIGRG